MDNRNVRGVREFFEYSKQSRSRIRRALREAELAQRRNNTSSDDEDGQDAPRRRRNNDAVNPLHNRESSHDSSSAQSSHGELADQGNEDSNDSSVPSQLSDSDNDQNIHQDRMNRNSEGESTNSDDIPSDQAERGNSGHESPNLDDSDQDLSLGNEDGPSDVRSSAGESSDSRNSEGREGEALEDVNLHQNQQQISGSEGEDENIGGEFGEEWIGPNNDHLPVYEQAPITLGESMYAILCFFLRHNLPQVCLSDLLSLIDLHCRREQNIFPKTVHNYKKYFQNIQFPVVKRHYCSVCYHRVNDVGNVCGHCNQARGFNFFLEISILAQLKALYKRPGFKDKLNHRFERRKFNDQNYEDIYDGEVYKEVSANNEILANPSNISLMWYTDGVSIFKSSKYELWPFYFVINELPYNDRTKISNALLAGVWFGKGKPAPATFLQSIRDDVLRLRAGIQVQYGNPIQTLRVKGIVIGGTADLPAKAKFLNFKNHNGRYGCSKCKMRSQYLGPGVMVYPYHHNLEMRSTAETVAFADEAMALPLLNGKRQDVYGVKGPSILSNFVFQYVRTTAVDVMHCAYINLCKSLLLFWFGDKFKNEDFSLFNSKRLVSERLSKITPPNYVQRLPRSLDDVKYWKAHEMKAFLFYYSLAVLHDIMPEIYFDHHKLVVGGLYLLNQRSVSQNMIAEASEVLHEYVSQFENLYGLDHMTCNLHQLLHLPTVTADFGPLWVTSCFPFESLNGKLKKLVKGTRYAELQVCSGVSMLMKLSELKLNIPQNGSAHTFCEKMFDSNRGCKFTPIGNNMAIAGRYVKKNDVPHVIRHALNRANIMGENFYEFYRLKKYSLVYSCEQYGRVVMTKSYCVKYTQAGIEGLGYIDRFIRVSNCDCPNFCFNCDPQYIALIRECQVLQEHLMLEGRDMHFLHTFHGFGELLAIDVSCLISMCFVLNVEDANVTFLVEPVNLIEAE